MQTPWIPCSSAAPRNDGSMVGGQARHKLETRARRAFPADGSGVAAVLTCSPVGGAEKRSASGRAFFAYGFDRRKSPEGMHEQRK